MTSEKRWQGAEEVPTMVEQGYNVVLYLWFGLMVPKGTPPAVVDFLHNNAVAVLEDPRVKEALMSQAAQGVGMGPAEMKSVMQNDAKSWSQILKEANITPD